MAGPGFSDCDDGIMTHRELFREVARELGVGEKLIREALREADSGEVPASVGDQQIPREHLETYRKFYRLLFTDESVYREYQKYLPVDLSEFKKKTQSN